MLHAGLDLSRRKVDVCLLNDRGEQLDQLAVALDVDRERSATCRRRSRTAGLRRRRVDDWCSARPRHARAGGLDVEIADAQKRRGLAPLACKTDKIDSMVLAVLSQRDLVPAIWLPDPRVREERELARFRMHLVKHKSGLKNRVHSTMINFGRPCPVTDLLGCVEGRRQIDAWRAWAGNAVGRADRRPRASRSPPASGRLADHPLVLHMSVPGVGRETVHDRRRDRRDRMLSSPR